MAETRKVLGQSYPNAGVLTTVYTPSTQAVVSTVMVCNQATSKPKVRISVAVSGAADASRQYIVYDAILEPNESQGYTIGATLGANDEVRVYSNTGAVSFNVFGVEL